MSKPPKKSENVRVAVRCRPANSVEKARGDRLIVTIDEAAGTVAIDVPKTSDPGCTDSDTRRFTFDYTYGSNAQQRQIYDQTTKPIVDSVLSGYNGTVFAYGQTGTGKTHRSVE